MVVDSKNLSLVDFFFNLQCRICLLFGIIKKKIAVNV